MRRGGIFPPAQEFGKRRGVFQILMPTAPTRIKSRPRAASGISVVHCLQVPNQGEMNMVKAVNTVTTSVRLPVDLVKRYDNLAKATGRSRTYYVTEALEESITQLEYQYGLLKKVEDYRAGRLETVSIDQLEDHLGLGD